MIRTIIAALAILISPAAIGQELKAVDLYTFCVSTSPIVQNVCSKYILGAVQGISLAAGKLGDKKTFCVPEDVSESVFVDTFVRTARADLAAYPQDKDIPAISMVGSVIVHNFPCPQ